MAWVVSHFCLFISSFLVARCGDFYRQTRTVCQEIFGLYAKDHCMNSPFHGCVLFIFSPATATRNFVTVDNHTIINYSFHSLLLYTRYIIISSPAFSWLDIFFDSFMLLHQQQNTWLQFDVVTIIKTTVWFFHQVYSVYSNSTVYAVLRSLNSTYPWT